MHLFKHAEQREALIGASILAIVLQNLPAV